MVRTEQVTMLDESRRATAQGSSAHSTHTKSPTTSTTRSSPHLPTYLQVRFPPLYTEVDALLGCWSMVTVCQERPWTPAVHTDRNVKRGVQAQNE